MTSPNILIFMTDHQRGDTILPEHPAHTPNVQRLAQEGLLFEQTFCPSPHCCPSRAAFHSGLYPPRSGVWNNVCNEQALSYGLKKNVRLWSEDLKDIGYELNWLGKWHTTAEESPSDRGWNELNASAVKGAHHGPQWDDYKKMAEKPEPEKRETGQILRPGWKPYTLYGTNEQGNSHDVTITEKAVEILPELKTKDAPWALFIGATGPHDPYYVPSRYLDMYDPDAVQLPESYTDEMDDKPRIYKRLREQIWGQLSEKEIREGIRHFWAYCTFLDDLFGRILSALEETGQAENTLVLYCSDHGDYCGDHGLFAKGIGSFRGAYHVPAAVRWPKGITDPGRRIPEFVSLTDFAPTFLEISGNRVQRDFSGSSLVPFFNGNTPDSWRDDLLMMCNGVELYYTQRILITRDYKYVFNGFDMDELYDLGKDPDEMLNLAEDPEYNDIKHDMVKRMWRSMYREQDSAINSYITVGLVPWGPGEAFRE